MSDFTSGAVAALRRASRARLSPSPRPASTLSRAGRSALDDAEHVERTVALNRAGREQLRAGLEALGLRVVPSAANFVLVDLARPSGPIYEGLLRHGVIARPLGNYGLALALILCNRFLDGVDGVMARLAGPTDRGAYLDIVCDMLFYAAVPLGFALVDPAANALAAAVLPLLVGGPHVPPHEPAGQLAQGRRDAVRADAQGLGPRGPVLDGCRWFMYN